ncbi:ABC transporter ATP-binding protein [Phytoactinopolyspora mesophila]|uniref:ATP-binding cassette domain-containing protein n=1 Tax=Phytoactinopolyspora mesophila TaxID=2650750 RepID=A0A7K3M0F3_9ACTN|nr:ABC transporter ATP-binding protein [Phytoactinopolyspora mesophila]NDL56507.1 ATP-binding cassette domain-containing protein [Phytoactinopolyspora mesophila]
MLLEMKHASKTFRASRGSGPVHAVKDATLQARPGEFVAIVGESGSGKSTLARMLLGLIPASSGGIELDGVLLAGMSRSELRHYRRSVQAVLQDPAGSLNPRKTVRRAIGEIVRLHRIASGRAAVDEKVMQVLRLVGFDQAETVLDRYPHEVSGGQRQRVLIARAIVLDPKIIVADEAVSALDASVKAGVLRLMNDLKERLGIGYVFITHDLPVVKKVADYVYVMKSGEIVEEGTKEKIFSDPDHPYTKTLLAASPVLEVIDQR